MSASVQKLDYSGWSDAQLARKAALDYRHPLHGVLSGLSDESRDASQQASWRMSARDFGNGHKECALWLHTPDLERSLDRSIDFDLKAPAVRGEGDREASQRASCRRAKQKVRHICKTMGVNSLWTLTYRACVTDRALVLRHLDLFRRKVQALLGEWKYIAVLEVQERGALHIHLATHALPVRLLDGGVKVKSWDVMRAVWRRVVGELGGNFDEAKRKGRWGSAKRYKGAGAIASYIAGYVAKDMQQSELNRKRYSVTRGVEIPAAVRAQWSTDVGFAELIELAYAAVGDRITRAWFCPVSQVFFVESDDSRSSG